MVRKRAPGGGRKPIGSTAAQPLTIRIDDDLRARLEAAATKRGRRKGKWNLSREILARLRLSLVREREERRDPAVQALCFLISRVAENVQGSHSLSKPWHLDPFTFRAFALGVGRVLATLAPRGEIRPPDISAPAHQRFFQSEGGRQLDPAEQAEYLHRSHQREVDAFKTPESAAEYAAQPVLDALFSSLAPKDLKAALADMGARHPEFEHLFEAAIEDAVYAASDARRDLGIKLKEPKS